MLVPGVSGGTTAIILGIYDRLIAAVSGLLHDVKKNLCFLMQVGLGGLIGAALFAKAVLWLTEQWYVPMMYVFSGAILGSIPLMVKKARIGKGNWYGILFALPGMAAALAVKFLPQTGNTGAGWLLLVCGIIVAAALILPGISTSHILLVMGMYETVLTAVTTMQWLYLGILGAGVLIGVILCTKLLEKAMQCFPMQTFMMITGFVMASVYDIFPGLPTGAEWLVCPILLTAAFVLVSMVSLRQG